MRKFLHVAIMSLALAASGLQNADAATIPVKACVTVKTSKVRIIANKAKCSKKEKQVDLNIPGTQGAPGKSILNGEIPPVDQTTGTDGDFYIDTAMSVLYGPRKAGLWGAGISLIGPRGGGGQGATGPAGRDGFITPDYASFDYRSAQTASVINTATPLALSNISGFSNRGITLAISDSSKITFSHAGLYNIAFSLQLIDTDSNKQGENIDIWLSKQGTTVPWTNTRVTLVKGAEKYVAAWNFFVDVTANQYVQLMWASTSLTAQIYAGAGSSAGPSIPSVILTVNQVG